MLPLGHGIPKVVLAKLILYHGHISKLSEEKKTSLKIEKLKKGRVLIPVESFLLSSGNELL